MDVLMRIKRFNPEKDRKPYWDEFRVTMDPIERLLDDASHALAAQSSSAGSLGALDGTKTNPSAVATVSDRESAGAPRGD